MVRCERMSYRLTQATFTSISQRSAPIRQAVPLRRYDRTSKFAFVEVQEKATQPVAADFLNTLIQVVPYKIHTVLTDNGVHFTTPGNRCSAAAEIGLALERGELFRAYAFEFACAKADIEHRLTKPKHPWTNGQVERLIEPLRRLPSNAFPTKPTSTSGNISTISSTFTTSLEGSRPSEDLLPMSTSDPSGQKNPNDSNSI